MQTNRALNRPYSSLNRRRRSPFRPTSRLWPIAAAFLGAVSGAVIVAILATRQP